jgi:Mrp family chromosome partitioning ATPase
MITLTQRAAATTNRNGNHARVAEYYYSLVHWIRSVGDGSGVVPKSIGITSCAPGAGVSTVASNLAIAAAQISDQPVLLLDLSSPRGYAGRATAEADLSEVLADVSRASEHIRPCGIDNLSVLSLNGGGGLQALSADCGKINDLVRRLEGEFGFVVVDLPTVDSSLCFVAAGSLNGVLLVMEAERTRIETAARAKQRLIDARAWVLGVVLNKHREHVPNWLEARF